MTGAKIPLRIRFNAFDVKSPLLSTSKLRKHGYSVVLDQQQTIQKRGTTIVLNGPERVANVGTETREQTGRSRRVDVRAGGRDRRGSKESNSDVRAQRTVGC